MGLIRLFKRDLAKECQQWANDQLITHEQAEKICDRYGVDYHNMGSHSYGYIVLLSLGYLFIGLAVITLLSANWDDIPRSIRMLGLVTLTLVTHLIALKKYQENNQSLSIGLFFLGSLFYGASIMLIAQIYHIDEHYPNGIFWWAMGVLPLALLLNSSLLMSLVMVLAYTWFWVEAELNYYPALAPVFLAAFAWHVFRVKQSNLLFLSLVIGASFWLELTVAWLMGDGYGYDFSHIHFILAAGIVISFYGLSAWFLNSSSHKLQDYGTVLGLWILRFTLLTLLIFSFDWLWEELIRTQWEYPLATAIVAIVFSMIAVMLSYGNQQKRYSTLIFTVVYLSATFSIIWTDNKDYAIYFQIAVNIILVVMGVWMIVKGIRDSITHYFFLGVTTILLTGLLRYIDLVGDYIGAAVLFIIFAAILLGAARFWKRQKPIQSAS